jgi:hypothetical protein
MTVSYGLLFGLSLSVVAQSIASDPVVIAQNQLDNKLIDLSFTPREYTKTLAFISNLNGNPNNSILAIAEIELDNLNIDLPLMLSKPNDQNEVRAEFNKSKIKTIDEYITKLEQNSTEPEIQTLKQNTSIESLKKAKNTEQEIIVKRVSFGSKSDNQELKKLELNKNTQTKNTTKSKVNQVTNLKTDTELDLEQITEVQVLGYTESQKKESLEQIKEQQKAKEMAEYERLITPEMNRLKQEKIKELKQKQESKKLEVEQKIKANGKSSISNEDIYELGEYAQKMELSPKINPAPKEFEEQYRQDNLKKEQEIKESEKKFPPTQKPTNEPNETKNKSSWLNALESVFNSLTGTVSTSAFSPQHYYENVNHATKGAHYGTSWDLYGGNTNDGAIIGLYNRFSSNVWNQRFYVNWDGTIVIGGKCVDLDGNWRANNQKIQLWNCNGGSAQKWVYDTEGRIRLKDNPYWCIDTYDGQAGRQLMLFNCYDNTEKFRAGDYEMKLFAERGFPYGGDPADVGHSWVAIQKLNFNNYVSENTTYGFWPSQDTNCSIPYWNATADWCTQIMQNFGQNMGSIHVNKFENWTNQYDNFPDITWSNDMHDYPYNQWTAKQQTRGIFKVKNITRSQADDVRGFGFLIPFYQNEQNAIGVLYNDMLQSNYSGWFSYWLQYYSTIVLARIFLSVIVNQPYNNGVYDAIYANCTGYAVSLWQKYGGNYYKNKYFNVVPLPMDLYDNMNSVIFW